MSHVLFRKKGSPLLPGGSHFDAREGVVNGDWEYGSTAAEFRARISAWRSRRPVIFGFIVGVVIMWLFLVVIATFLPVLNIFIGYYAGGESRRRFFDTDTFDVVADLEANFGDIQIEAINILNRTYSFGALEKYSQGLADEDAKWQSFFLRMYSWDFENNMKLCPTTAAILRNHSDTVTLAQFSVLHGPTLLKPHRGYFSGVLRLQFALVVPPDCTEANCFIRVAEEKRGWEEGKAIAFDDSLPHSVYIQGHGPRAVLFLDVVRPGLPSFVRFLVWIVMWFAPYVPPGANLYANAVATGA